MLFTEMRDGIMQFMWITTSLEFCFPKFYGMFPIPRLVLLKSFRRKANASTAKMMITDAITTPKIIARVFFDEPSVDMTETYGSITGLTGVSWFGGL